MNSDVAKRLDLLESERELARLIAEYCHGLDRRDLARFLDIWHEDAVFDTGGRGRYEGKDAIAAGVREKMWPNFRYGNHWTTNFVAVIDGDTAKGLSNLSFQGVQSDGTAVMVSATYHDDFSRRDGRWRISRRVIEIHHFAPVPEINFSAPRSAPS